MQPKDRYESEIADKSSRTISNFPIHSRCLLLLSPLCPSGLLSRSDASNCGSRDLALWSASDRNNLPTFDLCPASPLRRCDPCPPGCRHCSRAPCAVQRSDGLCELLKSKCETCAFLL